MQQVIEQLILTDRMAYLKEQLNASDRLGCKEANSTGARYKETDSTGANCKETDLDEVELIDVFDDLISPRNTVIYARKKDDCW